jgi:hypothetical protein
LLALAEVTGGLQARTFGWFKPPPPPPAPPSDPVNILIIFVPSNQQVVAPAKTDKPPDGDKTNVTSSVAQATTTTMKPTTTIQPTTTP